MEHMYYPDSVSKLPILSGKVTTFLDYCMQQKLQGNANVTLGQLVSNLSPEGKVSACWFDSFPGDYSDANEGVILRTTSQYDMPILTPLVNVKANNTYQEIRKIVMANVEAWSCTSWRYVQEESVGVITQELIDKIRNRFDDFWNEDEYGPIQWDSNLLLGKSIPMYGVRTGEGKLYTPWVNQPEVCADLNLLFPTLVDKFSTSYNRDLTSFWQSEFITEDFNFKPEYKDNEFLNRWYYEGKFKLNNLAISLEHGYTAFGNFESVSSEVLNVPLGMLHPFLIMAYFTHSLNKAEKAFPDFTGLFKTTRKIPDYTYYVAAFWKPYYNLCHIFNS